MYNLLSSLGQITADTWKTVGIVAGILFGVALVIVIAILVVGKVFKVDMDEKVTKILENLAGANCGGCGCSGCAGFAAKLADGTGEIVVHGEGFARPVHGGTEFLDLFKDLPAVLLLPVPHALDERFAAHVVTLLAFLGERALHHVLRGDARMVGAGNPQNIFTLLAGMTAEYVLKSLVQGMTDMQDTRDVGRRNDDGIRIAGGGHVGRESPGFFPVFTPVSFHFLGFVGFGQH